MFYGETANKIRFLKDETNLFERALDVYMAGGAVGMLFNEKGEDKRAENKVTIFAEQIANESMRIKYLSSLAFLIENNDENLDKDELLKQTFSDWFSNVENEDSEQYRKYKLFKLYAIGGIDMLYDKIVGESTDEKSYLRNYRDFIKKIDDQEVSSNSDRAILKGLMG